MHWGIRGGRCCILGGVGVFGPLFGLVGLLWGALFGWLGVSVGVGEVRVGCALFCVCGLC